MDFDEDDFSVGSGSGVGSKSLKAKKSRNRGLSMLTYENMEPNMTKVDRVIDEDFEKTLDRQVRDKALRIYKDERNIAHSLDLGLHGVTRASLRTLVKTSILESSATMKRRYSYSAMSSAQSAIDPNNAISALRTLQKERLIVSRLGFPDKAQELDRQIESMRAEAKKMREEEDNNILNQKMKSLAISQSRKQQRLEYVLAEEVNEMKAKFQIEEEKLLRRQEQEFLQVLEATSRRALGRIKKCNCDKAYVCKHNKTASYNTRRPIYTVVLYRRNAKRLKRAGRAEEGSAWEEKAREIDEAEQEKWRKRIAESIVSSPWGANEASVDQITELHKKELAILHKTHAVKADMQEKKHLMRRKNFRSTILAEERKVRMQCRKQALLRIRKNYTEETRERDRQKSLLSTSDGLKNISKNLLGNSFNDSERANVDWVAPTSFGLDNSVRLVDAVKEVGDEDITSRILTSKKDIKTMDAKTIQDKIRREAEMNYGEVNSEEDSDEEENGAADEEEDEDLIYRMGATSGSKLVDTMRMKQQQRDDKKKLQTQTQENLQTPLAPPMKSSFEPPQTSFNSNLNYSGNNLFAANTPSSFPAINNTTSFPQPTFNSFGNQPFPSMPTMSTFDNSNGFVKPTEEMKQVFAPSTPAPTTPSFRAGLHLSTTKDSQSEITKPIPFPSLDSATVDTFNGFNSSTEALNTSINKETASTIPSASNIQTLNLENQKKDEPIANSFFVTQPAIPTNSTNPFGAPVTNNPFGAPVTNNPFSAPVTNNPFSAPVIDNPFSAPVTNNPFMAPAVTNQLDETIESKSTNSVESNNPPVLIPTEDVVDKFANGTGMEANSVKPFNAIKMSSGDPFVSNTIPDNTFVPPNMVKPESENNGANPFGMMPTTPNPFGPPVSNNPFGPPVSNNPFGPPVLNNPFGPPVSNNPFGPPVLNNPFGPPVSNNPFGVNNNGPSNANPFLSNDSFKAPTSVGNSSFISNIQILNDDSLCQPCEEVTTVPSNNNNQNEETDEDADNNDNDNDSMDDASVELNTNANRKIDIDGSYITRSETNQNETPKSSPSSVLDSWTYDPLVDDNPNITFKPGSRKDEDWAEHDAKMAEGFGTENSYGTSIESMSSSGGGQLNSPIAKVVKITDIAQNPPMPGTPMSFPKKGALSETNNSSLKKSLSKSVQFGENTICVFEEIEEEPKPKGSNSLFPSAKNIVGPQTSLYNNNNNSTPNKPTAPEPKKKSTKKQNNNNNKEENDSIKNQKELSNFNPVQQLSNFNMDNNSMNNNFLNNNSSFNFLTNFSSQPSWMANTSMNDSNNNNNNNNDNNNSGMMNNNDNSLMNSLSNQFNNNMNFNNNSTFDSDNQSGFLNINNNNNNNNNQLSAPWMQTAAPISNALELQPHAPPLQSKPQSQSRPLPQVTPVKTDNPLITNNLTDNSIPPANPFNNETQSLPFQQNNNNVTNPFQPQPPSSNPFQSVASINNPFQSQPPTINPFEPQAPATNPFQPTFPTTNPFQSQSTITANPFQSATPINNPFQTNEFNNSFQPTTSSSTINNQSLPVVVNNQFQPNNDNFNSIDNEPIKESQTFTSNYEEMDADQSDSQSFSVDGNGRKKGFDWELCFFRLTNLSNVVMTLEQVLSDDDFFEAAELFISTHDYTPEEIEELPATNDIQGQENWIQETTMKLQLLKGWKDYQRDNKDVELLLMTMEDVFKMDPSELLENISMAVESKKKDLQQLLEDTAHQFIPLFILSTDFSVYFDNFHSALRANNKRLHTDSKTWMARFQKVVDDYSYPVHIFNANGSRPYANKKMKALFGPMCDSPSPREYLDLSTDPQTINNIVMSMKEGVDTTSGVTCRTVRSGKLSAFLCIKHLYSYKNSDKLKYSIVMIVDRENQNPTNSLRVVKAIIQSFPVFIK